MGTHKERTIVTLEKLLERAEKTAHAVYGFEHLRDAVDGAIVVIKDAVRIAGELHDDAKPSRRPRGAHVVSGRIYEIKEKARKNYAALGADLSACVVESIDGDSARVLLVSADGDEIRAVVKLAHFGPEVK